MFISIVPASAEDAQFRANPEHTGVYGNGGIVPGNTELWRFATGAGVYSSPAVANGVVYVGSEDKNLYAIGANTSSLTTVPTTIPSTPIPSRVTDAGRPTSRATTATMTTTTTSTTTAPARQATRRTPLQYALPVAIIVAAGMVIRKSH